MGQLQQPRRISNPAPKPSPTPIPRGGGGGGSYGGGGGYTSPAPAVAPAPAPKPPSEEDFLASDAAYQAQMAALKKALENYLADTAAQKTKYNTSYDTSVKNLGWLGDEGWNREDQNTSSGRAYQSLNNDFAGRGLLQSSAYGEAVDDLFRSLNDQYSAMNKDRTNFMDDLARQTSQFKNENTLSQQQARAESLARRAAKYDTV